MVHGPRSNDRALRNLLTFLHKNETASRIRFIALVTFLVYACWYLFGPEPPPYITPQEQYLRDLHHIEAARKRQVIRDAWRKQQERRAAESLAAEEEANRPKTWLFIDKGSQFYHENDLTCSVPWAWTNDEGAADAIIYNVLENGGLHDYRRHPRKIRPEQKNVFISLESGTNYPYMYGLKRRGFDIMMDYRVYDHPKGVADIPIVYYNNSLTQKATFADLKAPPFFPKRTDAWISVFISDCDPANNRNTILKELMKLLPGKVHSYGKCFHNRELPSAKHQEGKQGEEKVHYMDQKREKIEIAGQYLFHFAAENSNEPGYVTEKVYQALEAGTVPIYIGAPDVDKFLPNPGAVIKVADFESTQALAAHIKELASKPEKYARYFDWKEKEFSQDFQQVLKLASTTTHCKLAKLLAGVDILE